MWYFSTSNYFLCSVFKILNPEHCCPTNVLLIVLQSWKVSTWLLLKESFTSFSLLVVLGGFPKLYQKIAVTFINILICTHSHSKLQNCLWYCEAVVHHSPWCTISSRKGEDVLGVYSSCVQVWWQKTTEENKEKRLGVNEEESEKDEGEPERIKIQRLNRTVWKSTETSKYLQLFIVEFQAISQWYLHLYKV